MPPGDPPDDPVRRFAAEVAELPIGPDSGELETRSALFRKLRDEDFLPDPLGHEAILALAGRPISPVGLLAEALRRAEERRLHLEVEDYAARFFDEPVASRADRYRRLGMACDHDDRLIERLRLLRPGLAIERSSVDDPSPVVKRLLDDLLVLFPMGPEARAREARGRAQGFRSDPALTDSERAKALKALAKRHPGVVDLVPDYPSRLREGRSATSAGRLLRTLSAEVESPSELFNARYWVIAAVVLGGVLRLMVPSSTNQTFAPVQTPSFPSPQKFPIIPATNLIALAIREEFKPPIRRELARIGKFPADPVLDEIVGGLPVEQLAQVGGMKTIVMAKLWADPIRDQFIARLKKSLKASPLGLTEEELDEVAPRCFPQSSGPGLP